VTVNAYGCGNRIDVTIPGFSAAFVIGMAEKKKTPFGTGF
jgi:hypothetical protein